MRAFPYGLTYPSHLACPHRHTTGVCGSCKDSDMSQVRRGFGRSRSDLAAAVQVPTEPPSCVHHWMLGEPSNGWVDGSCRRCGEARRFPGSPESTQRFDDYRELTASSAYVERLSA